VGTNGIEHVTALPIRWNTGRQGAPPPDEAVLVRGETNLFSTQLWFMQGGAQSVEVAVQGRAGEGTVIVPVNAVATRVLQMPHGLGELLACCGALLFLLLVTMVGAAVRESALAPGEMPSRRRRWLARAASAGAVVLLGAALWGGKRWWDSEAADYRNNRLYHPLQTRASVYVHDGRSFLRLEIADERFSRGAPIVPDHGKLMHLFLIDEPGLNAFAHLHPAKLDWNAFENALPDLPAGRYSVYADITTETGFAETLTATVTLSPTTTANPGDVSADPDDSWWIGPPGDGSSKSPTGAQSDDGAEGGWHTEWIQNGPLQPDRQTALRFRVQDRAGQVAPLEPYLGMAGHLVLRREDGTVFTHLHPSGSFSMAAQQLFEMRAEGKAPLKAAHATNDPLCRLPTLDELTSAWRRDEAHTSDGIIAFPYAFPKPGRYRMWFQFRLKGRVRTVVFDADVAAPSSDRGR
jgi:hypothetical protein